MEWRTGFRRADACSPVLEMPKIATSSANATEWHSEQVIVEDVPESRSEDRALGNTTRRRPALEASADKEVPLFQVRAKNAVEV